MGRGVSIGSRHNSARTNVYTWYCKVDNEVWLHVKDHSGLGRARSPRNEQRRDAHEYLYTPDTLNTGMYTKSRMSLNHRRRRCDRRHRNASLIFPNAERNCRGHKLPCNDRCSGCTSISLRGHSPRPVSPSPIVNYARKGSAIINFWRVRGAYGGTLDRSGSCERDVIEGAPPPVPPTRCTNTTRICTRVRCGPGTVGAVSLLSGWQPDYAARKTSVTRAAREIHACTRGAAQFAPFHPLMLMRIGNLFANSNRHVTPWRYPSSRLIGQYR